MHKYDVERWIDRIGDQSSHSRAVEFLDLATHDDGQDDAVDGNGCAENDAEQARGSYSGSFDSATEDTGARCVNARGCTDDGKRNCQTDSHASPKVGRDGSEEAGDIKLKIDKLM